MVDRGRAEPPVADLNTVGAGVDRTLGGRFLAIRSTWLRGVALAKILYLTDEPGGHEGAATLIKPFAVEALVDAVRRLLATPPATG